MFPKFVYFLTLDYKKSCFQEYSKHAINLLYILAF